MELDTPLGMTKNSVIVAEFPLGRGQYECLFYLYEHW